jgi:cytochrome c nitrite reductase small subunit
MKTARYFWIAAGLFAGIGLFNVQYARGTSYLKDDPAACANCHVMGDVYASWRKSSHHGVAVCNDCHTPPGWVPKYATKALNGFFHSWAFTMASYPDNIRITERNRRVTESACLKCHASLTEDLRAAHRASRDVSCLHCHRQAGHH